MDEIIDVFLSWQFLLVGIVVFFVFAFFNQFLGPRLWAIQNTTWRSIMKFLEGIKMVWPPLLGFGLGWVPQMPRPEPLTDQHQVTVAMLYLVAGLGSAWIVQGVKKALEARGIDVELDMSPKEQKKAKGT